MKKATIAFFALAALAVAAPAFSAVLLDEPFTYSDGDIAVVSGGLWVNHSGVVNPTIASGEAVIDGINNTGDVNRAFAQQTSTSKTYACFEARVTGNAPASGSYFAHFRPTANLNFFRSRVFVMNEPALTSFTFGLNVTSTGATSLDIPWGPALNFGQVYRVVHSYDAATGVAELWVDPVSEASTKITSTLAAAGGEAVDQYALRQASTTVFVNMDNLKVGQSFSDVCDGATPTSATSWGRMKALYR